MVSIRTTITNESGLHARPATQFAMKAKEFSSKITVRNMDREGEAVNGKSMLRLLSQGLSMGTHVEIAADGPDEQSAVQELVRLLESDLT